MVSLRDVIIPSTGDRRSDIDALMEDVRAFESAWRWLAEDEAAELGIPSDRLAPIVKALVELHGLPLAANMRSNYRNRIFASLYGRNPRAPRRGYATTREPLTTIELT